MLPGEGRIVQFSQRDEAGQKRGIGTLLGPFLRLPCRQRALLAVRITPIRNAY